MRCMPLNRRRLLVQGMATGGTFALAASPVAAALLRTPPQTRGPFYPSELPLDADNDLVSVRGRSDLAKGQIVHLAGQILDPEGYPVPDSLVEIWQCDAQGVYHHPRERGGPADAAFQGYGRTIADGAGRYRFRTIKPVPYPGRTPHIHFQVTTPSRVQLVTQMYLKDHPLNARDFIFKAIDNPRAQASLQVAFAPAPEIEPGAEAGRFDIVLG